MDMINATTHDTAAPLACCDRCRTAELSRRSGRRPAIKFSQTAASGQVAVLHGARQIALLRKDALFGWYAESAIAGLECDADGWDRRELLGIIAERYANLWRAGAV